MTRGKRKVINKIQSLFRESVSDNIFGVLFAELAKILRLNHYTFATARFYFSGFQPASIDPTLHRVRPDMKRDSQRVFCEAVFTHLCIGAKTVQHVPNGAL